MNKNARLKITLISIFIITALLFSSSCSIEEQQRSNNLSAKKLANNFVYVKDNRTGVCYAFLDADSYYRSVTYVPCHLVKKYLKQ